MASLEGMGRVSLEACSNKELVQLCKKRSIPYSARNKADLVDSLMAWKAKQTKTASFGWARAKDEPTLLRGRSSLAAKMEDIVAASGRMNSKTKPSKPGRKVVAVDSLEGTSRGDLEQFLKDHLILLCKERSIPYSGLNKDELVDDLLRWKRDVARDLSAAESAKAPAKRKLPKAPAPPRKTAPATWSYYSDEEDSDSGSSSSSDDEEPTSRQAPQAHTHNYNRASPYQKMSKKSYLRRMQQADPSSTHDDVHVCHVISKANGGADAKENYVLMNGALNMKLGTKGDHVMVYVVGIHKANHAVSASKSLKNYSGPEAHTLYQRGEAFFRNHFGAQLRKDSQDRLKEAARYFS